jgi:hypothetical protein
VLSATVKWGGCKERFGYTRFDHALIECKIRVTLRAIPITPKAKDWGTTDPRVWAELDVAAARKLKRTPTRRQLEWSREMKAQQRLGKGHRMFESHARRIHREDAQR